MAAHCKEKSESHGPLRQGDHAGVSFVVGMDGDCLERPRSAPRKRFRNYQKKTVSRDQLEQKQVEAEIRRKVRMNSGEFDKLYVNCSEDDSDL